MFVFDQVVVIAALFMLPFLGRVVSSRLLVG